MQLTDRGRNQVLEIRHRSWLNRSIPTVIVCDVSKCDTDAGPKTPKGEIRFTRNVTSEVAFYNKIVQIYYPNYPQEVASGKATHKTMNHFCPVGGHGRV